MTPRPLGNGRPSGLDRGALAILAEAILRIEGREVTWSPTPVLGYRGWAVHSEGLYGVRVRWATPELAAECPTTGHRDDLPHIDRRCGRLGCGIYAAKEMALLVAELPPLDSHPVAFGTVAMSGKVVEHERGYRAAAARVTALAVAGAGPLLLTDDPDEITAIFACPADRLQLSAPSEPAPVEMRHIERFLDIHSRRTTPWTSVSNSG